MNLCYRRLFLEFGEKGGVVCKKQQQNNDKSYVMSVEIERSENISIIEFSE